MADVFLSYAAEDRVRVKPIVEMIEGAGFSVWWDRRIGLGSTFDREIERELDSARCVVVVWSKHSVDSDWVRNEAQDGLDRGVLIPLLIDDVRPPLAFRRSQTAVLSEKPTRDELSLVLTAVESVSRKGRTLRRPSSGHQGHPSGQPALVWHKRNRALLYVGSLVVLLAGGIIIWIARNVQAPIDTAEETPAPTPAAYIPVGSIPTTITVAVLPLLALGSSSQIEAIAEVASSDLLDAFAEAKVAIADASTAELVVTGTVRMIGEASRFSMRLERTRDGRLIWAKQIEQPSSVTDRLQRAPFVANQVETVLGFYQQAESSGSSNPQARDEFLSGLLALLDDLNFQVAVNHWERATEMDPDYAAAYAWITNAYASRLSGTIRADEALPKAHAAAEKAISLAPNLAPSVSLLNQFLDLDYEAAIRNWEHGRWIGLIDVGVAERGKCTAYFRWGDIEKALVRCRNAAKHGAALNQPDTFHQLGRILLSAGQYREAKQALESAAAMYGDNRAWSDLAEAYHYLGDSVRSNDLLDKAWATSREAKPFQFPGVMALLDRPEEARRILAQAEARLQDGSLVNFAEVFHAYLYLGELDRAFLWLERCIDNRELIGEIKSATYFDELRSDPRFELALEAIREIEMRGTPTPTIATNCMERIRLEPPEEELESCFFEDVIAASSE